MQKYHKPKYEAALGIWQPLPRSPLHSIAATSLHIILTIFTKRAFRHSMPQTDPKRMP
ncbi:hypothetical protein A9G15_10565 [Acetobacter orientalis]|uniref:Uncharacterized protein n=1 Tax=Acetobacter orientalis TaxID=146474 RepID=A0A2Z5ZHK8_9PROT|nr:hypothetical protein A9G15_10565 [Acetobacter orientalis]